MPRNHTRRDSCLMCVVCCEEIEFFAIGQCDHPICLVCCVRMRVLGKEIYCAVCRADLNKIILTKSCAKWSEIKDELQNGYVDKKLGLCYTSKEIHSKVKELLQHKCSLCPDRPPEKSFEKLRDHIKKEHNMFYCNICIQHHRKFSQEWKMYSRADLATHRRVGDPDDTSHKGHPICRFCEDRFLDDDELHRHLRKNHFWCHICENDGKQLYFLDYLNLRTHFKDEHFLCEEDMCKYEQFTSVFRSDIDFQAHRASKHSQKMSKAQVRQARQLEVDLVYNQRPAPTGRTVTGQDFAEVRATDQRFKRQKPKGSGTCSSKRQDETNLQTAMKNSLTTNNKPRTPSPPLPTQNSQAPKEDNYAQLDHSDFPTLAGSIENITINTVSTKIPGRNIQSFDDFPTLASGSTSQPNGKPPPGFNNLTTKETPNVTTHKNPPPGFKKLSPPITKKSDPPLKTQTEATVKKKDVPPPEKNTEIPKSDAPSGNKNTSSRNQAFIENVKMLLGNDIEKFKEFKTLSGKFRQGQCSAQEYYSNCTTLFDSNFNFIFNELVSLLPDLDKQRELLGVHNDTKARAKQNGISSISNGGKRPPPQTAWGPKPASKPKPVKTPKGIKQGVTIGHEVDFPSLPTAGPRQMKAMNIYRPSNTQPMKSAWVRGK